MFKSLKKLYTKIKEKGNKCPYCGSSNIKEDFLCTNDKTPTIRIFILRFMLFYPASVCKCEDCAKE